MKDVPPAFVDGWRATGEYESMVAQAASLLADAQALAWAASAPLPQLISGVRVPVLTLVGTEAFPGMDEAGAAITAAIPGARHERVPGAHHTWEPHEMAARLVRFVGTAHRAMT